jgi:hypothetical protein
LKEALNILFALNILLAPTVLSVDYILLSIDKSLLSVNYILLAIDKSLLSVDYILHSIDVDHILLYVDLNFLSACSVSSMFSAATNTH